MLAERGLAGKSGAVPSNQGPFLYRTVMKDVAREEYRACIRPKGGAGATEAGSRLITRAVVLNTPPKKNTQYPINGSKICT